MLTGSMRIVRIWNRCSSARIALPSASTACLLLEYAPLPATVTCPATEDSRTIRDNDASLAPALSSGKNVCVTATSASTLVSN